MSAPIILGTGESGPVAIDLPRLLGTRLLIQANSGAGKSWALRRLLEQSHGQVQQIVLDAEGEFHTLRERFDYVLAAATGGDCLASPKTASLLARRLLELGVSAIVDLYELPAHDRVRFVRLFLSALIAAPRELWRPALILLDEAHLFCPQTGQAESAGAVIDLMTRGRKRGFCGVLATQRISKLHKDAAAEANNKLVGRSALDLDMARAGDELGFKGRDQQLQLRGLGNGEFFAFGPAISPTVTRLKVGSVATTHPQAGMAAPPPAPPSAKVKAALAGLADLAAEAAAEETTIDGLRARVRELERAAKAPAIDAKAVAEAKATGREEGRRDAWAAIAKATAKASAALGHARAAIDQTSDLLAGVVETASGAVVEQSSHVEKFDHSVGSEKSTRRPPPAPSRSNGRGAGAELRLLDVLVARRSERITTRQQLATLAGLSWRGGTFGTYLSRLRSRGLIAEEPGGGIIATADGIATRPNVAPIDRDAVLRNWIGALGAGAAGRMLQAIADTGPGGLDRDQLAGACALAASGGTFSTYLSRLRSNALIEESSSRIRLAPALQDRARLAELG